VADFKSPSHKKENGAERSQCWYLQKGVQWRVGKDKGDQRTVREERGVLEGKGVSRKEGEGERVVPVKENSTESTGRPKG